MSQSKNLQKWIERINSGPKSDSVIVDALLKIRPISKSRAGIQDLHKHDGIQCLINLIQRPNCKVLDISSSILANCLTEEIARQQVLKCKGIPKIVKLLQTVKHDGIITRTCRSIANLANNLECCQSIHSIGTIPLLLKIVRDSKSSTECVTSALRALKNLADTPSHRKREIQNGCVSAAAELLHSESEEVLVAAVCALSAISRSCTLEFADHMLGNEGNAVKNLVRIIEKYEMKSKLKTEALSILINLTLQGCARPTIGSTGGLGCIISEIRMLLSMPGKDMDGVKGPKTDPLPENSFRLVGALCYCCREAVNRAKLRSMDALPLFIELLLDHRWQSVHSFILITLLCFVYDEEGLKILHENGIFSVLLEHLADYVQQSKITACTKDGSESAGEIKERDRKQLWDGHDLDEEGFDSRHSLSYDVPTKFNKRASLLVDDDPSFEALTQFELNWRESDLSIPYSPQWSPLGPSPVPGDSEASTELVAFSMHPPPADETVPKHPDEDGFIDLAAIEASDPVLEQDDSSSSRDSFDTMLSPALLPASISFKPSDEGKDKQRIKRERGDSSSSNDSLSSNLCSEKLPSTNPRNSEFWQRMEVDLQHAPKKIKLENLKTDDRIRSRSLDNDVQKKTMENANTGSIAGPSSPSPALIIPEFGGKVCSPSFLQFVSETCSVPPSILQHAGREGGNTAGSSSAAAWKPARRRRSSGSKSQDVVEGRKIGDNSTAQHPPTDASPLKQKAVPMPSEKTTESIPILLKTVSSPSAWPKESTKAPVCDTALTGPEPVTLDQIILCLLCHYCEMDDAYVVSLAQQDSCVKSFSNYIADYQGEISPKLNRILDRLTSCPECFRDMIASSLLPSIASCISTMKNSNQQCCSDSICPKCDAKMPPQSAGFLNNVIHNFVLAHTSLFGSNTMKRMIVKGNAQEISASSCTLLLLCLWYFRSQERMKSVSQSTLKYLVMNLRLLVEHDRLNTLFASLQEKDEGSTAFRGLAYTFTLLTSCDSSKVNTIVEEYSCEESRRSSEDEESLLTLFQSSNSVKLEDGSSCSASECKYDSARKKAPCDKVLVFAAQEFNREPAQVHKLRSGKLRRTRRNAVKCKVEEDKIGIHVDTLSNKCAMFEAMLCGKYRESTKPTIVIRDVPYEAALYTIHRMYGCQSSDCYHLRNILAEFRDHTDSRYESFSTSVGISKNLPVEISILRVMDLWLLPDEKRLFWEENEEFFIQHYITKEIARVQTDQSVLHGKSDRRPAKQRVKYLHKRGTIAQKMPLNAKPSKPQSHLKFSEFYFLNFLINHGFSNSCNSYLNALFTSCLFQHDHMIQGRFLSAVLQHSKDPDEFSRCLYQRLSEMIEKIIHDFQLSAKKRV